MEVEEYILGTRTTWKYYADEERNKNHALLGIGSEIGEIATAYKKVIGYDRPMNIVNLMQECGDCIYYLARIVDQFDLSSKCLLADDVFLTEIDGTDIVYQMWELANNLKMSLESLSNKKSKERYIQSLCTILAIILNTIDLTLPQAMEVNHKHLKRAWDNKDRGITRDEEAEAKYIAEMTNAFMISNIKAKEKQG